ncbi:glycosyltransferase [Pedobacter sp. ISL-68]|uniref:glycosyltransferase family 2 protein n=1 Tax=unclassified Pedobacter TaxID=2628915 RepID=UPI001BE52817|nr:MULTISPECIES: glycosyltransferase family 2 protein [unclassified Pedobacter]MBT2559668.1 glycosyltransferase [Pedobacter sp. ISL-64]MBT2591973.1 glycosyltransferase [Pedobacter sp. ISL-68]
MSKKLSIITINYNNKAGLQKTIQSVVSQTWQDFEFIVIDGNSLDGSKDVLNTYSSFFSYYVSEPDSGIYNAMNKGIKISTGDYLMFLNSGDSLIDNTILEKLNAELNGQYDIYYGDILHIDGIKKEIRTFPEKLNFAFFYEQNISHQASFIKAKLFKDIFLYNENLKIVADWEFFTYAICKREASYKHLDCVIVTYDGTGISANSKNHPGIDKERDTSLNRYFPEFVKDYEYLKEIKFKKAEQFMHIKKYPIAYKILKGFMNIILLFLPKFNRN